MHQFTQIFSSPLQVCPVDCFIPPPPGPRDARINPGLCNSWRSCLFLIIQLVCFRDCTWMASGVDELRGSWVGHVASVRQPAARRDAWYWLWAECWCQTPHAQRVTARTTTALHFLRYGLLARLAEWIFLFLVAVLYLWIIRLFFSFIHLKPQALSK